MNTLGFFFTRGISLKTWIESGLFDREVLIYHEHISSKFIKKIYWFTYGVNDSNIAKELINNSQLNSSIQVVSCPKFFNVVTFGSSFIYSLFLPLIHFRLLLKCDMYKTNQMDGVLPALISSFCFGRPLYTRTGYTFSRVVDKVSSKFSLRRSYAYLIELMAFKLSCISSVSSNFDYSYIVGRYKLTKVPEIVGNYIDVNKFNSEHYFDNTDENSILFVGRLSPEKNLENTIIACSRLGLTLNVIGKGDELSNLNILATKYKANVNWLGTVSNNELPFIFKNYKYFILPSLWEGMPKSLLEAMSSGLICIGNDTSGINEIINDGRNGFLSSSHDFESIIEAINRAKNCKSIDVSKAARNFIKENYSISAILEKEQIIFKKILANSIK